MNPAAAGEATYFRIAGPRIAKRKLEQKFKCLIARK